MQLINNKIKIDNFEFELNSKFMSREARIAAMQIVASFIIGPICKGIIRDGTWREAQINTISRCICEALFDTQTKRKGYKDIIKRDSHFLILFIKILLNSYF